MLLSQLDDPCTVLQIYAGIEHGRYPSLCRPRKHVVSICVKSFGVKVAMRVNEHGPLFQPCDLKTILQDGLHLVMMRGLGVDAHLWLGA